MHNMRKSVSFGEISVSELKEADTPQQNALWYNKDEIISIRKSAKSVSATEDGCTRGLELTEENIKRRLRHVQSVLELQDEHREQDLVDEKGLQRYASALSKDEAKQAQRRASLDSVNAFQLYKEEQNDSLSSFLTAASAEEYSKPTRRMSLKPVRRPSMANKSMRRISTMPKLSS
ncbi:expressed unknown protein [Seminavis robusta]|uniref:Uncharacterized protein n=1 Tax=Seminavis robusta TaxID=568900 RepID=A0A9N8HLD2_9STRA|nr:expressed unknown protein [Seminavis robusta]|eukprot:Sro1021_g232210.1 n/a (176) ;mRNA; f:8772-9299